MTSPLPLGGDSRSHHPLPCGSEPVPSRYPGAARRGRPVDLTVCVWGPIGNTLLRPVGGAAGSGQSVPHQVRTGVLRGLPSFCFGPLLPWPPDSLVHLPFLPPPPLKKSHASESAGGQRTWCSACPSCRPRLRVALASFQQPAHPGDTAALPAPRLQHRGGGLGPVLTAAAAQGQEVSAMLAPARPSPWPPCPCLTAVLWPSVLPICCWLLARWHLLTPASSRASPSRAWVQTLPRWGQVRRRQR